MMKTKYASRTKEYISPLVERALNYIDYMAVNNPGIKSVYLPMEAYNALWWHTFNTNKVRKPTPPKYLVSKSNNRGLFSHSNHESWEYDYQDPDYLNALERYKESKKDSNNFRIMVCTVRGDVEIKLSETLELPEGMYES